MTSSGVKENGSTVGLGNSNALHACCSGCFDTRNSIFEYDKLSREYFEISGCREEDGRMWLTFLYVVSGDDDSKMFRQLEMV